MKATTKQKSAIRFNYELNLIGFFLFFRMPARGKISNLLLFLLLTFFSRLITKLTLNDDNWMIFFLFADGGEGHVGTLCEVGRSGSTHSPEKTVVVNWDSGHRTNYRVGYQGQYDLIVIDNAQIGVRHQNIICDGCKKAGIAGILFRCAECANFDLCAHCYGLDYHDLEHSFVRYQTANSVG